MKKRLCTFLAAMILVTTAALAAPARPENGYVADEAGVLTQETIDHINKQNQVLFENTGAIIAIATVEDTGGEAIDRYTYTLFNNWGVGDRDASNGLLLLLDIGGDNYFAAPGKNIKNDLTDSKISDLLYDYLEADFAAKDYDAGVKKVFDAFYDWYEAYYTQPSGGQESAGNVGGSILVTVGIMWPFLVLVGFVILVVVVDGMRWRSYRRHYLLPGMPPPRVMYTPFLWGRSYCRPHHHHHSSGPRSPRPPRPPMGGSFRGSGFGGGMSRGGGAGRSSRPSRSFRSGGRGGFGGGMSRGGGAGRR